ncbi:MAG: nucleoside monophosphate kinase [Candidatus Woesearchaeota archaeon]
MNRYLATLIFGPPGVGKGTQAKLLAKTGDYFHFSTGDRFRNIDTGTDIGAKVRSLIDGGNFVPDELVMKMFGEMIDTEIKAGAYDPEKQYIILDGIPRTVPQVLLIDSTFHVKRLIYLDAPDQMLIDRILSRGKLEGRADDQDVETIKHRLDTYRKKTLPLLEEYPEYKITIIDGSGTIDDVYSLIQEEIRI